MALGRPRFWDRKGPISLLLVPVSTLFGIVVAARRAAYRLGWLRSYRPPVPVIVVGNLTVGGTGKTPLVLWIVRFLQSRGWAPGIVSRGFGGCSATWPRSVDSSSDPLEVGDEPVLLAKRSGCPVAVGPKRSEVCETLLAAGCDVLVCDDGMQHYALQRDMEIVVRDGVRGWGNGLLMPAGPLREPVARWRDADLAVCNGGVALGDEFRMTLEAGDVASLANPGIRRPLGSFAGGPVHAVAGIGDPERFFQSLRDAGLEPHCHPFPDHHHFREDDLRFSPHAPVLMTEKDAVKFVTRAPEGCWYVPVEAKLPDRFSVAFCRSLARASQKPS